MLRFSMFTIAMFTLCLLLLLVKLPKILSFSINLLKSFGTPIKLLFNESDSKVYKHTT